MYFISIDVGKYKHTVSVTDNNGVVLVRPFDFANNIEGFNALLSAISKYRKPAHLVALEATGHYGDNLIRFLLDHDFIVGQMNPICTSDKRKQGIRKAKNDSIDTSFIAKVAQDGDYSQVTEEKLEMAQLKELTRLHSSLKEEVASCKNRLQKCIDIVFPEYNTLFRSKYSKPYMAILKEFGTAHAIAQCNLRHLKNVISKAYTRGRPIDLDADLLRETARKSVGQDRESTALQIRICIENIELLTDQIAMVDKKIEESIDQLDSPILSIPGIGPYTAACILSEIGDIKLFSSARKLIGFAGMDPGTYQSGQYKAPVTALSKRGSRYLRKALYQCILPVCKANPIFNNYYRLKRSQGKSHRCAQGHTIRKLLRVIYKLLSDNVKYNADLLR